MSAVKFDYPTYKFLEPQYHPQRPIIIDADAIESPETATLKYEEEAAARANGGGLRGESPHGLLAIDACSKPEPPQMHSFESPRSYQNPPYQYAGQGFTTPQTENAAASQLNHMAFAANNSASPYLSSVVPTVTSYEPASGLFGTKVVVKVAAPYDWMAMTSQLFLAFGQHRSPAQAIRDGSDGSGLGYIVSADAPQQSEEDTGMAGVNVPISLLIESADGQTLASLDVGTFTYHDGRAMGTDGSHDDITRRPLVKSGGHQRMSTSDSPSRQHQHQQEESDQQQLQEAAAVANATNNIYPYVPASDQVIAPSYDADGYQTTNNTTNNMLSTYSRPSYGAEYPRPPSLFKGPSWAGLYGASLTSPRSPPSSNIIHHNQQQQQQQQQQQHQQQHHHATTSGLGRSSTMTALPMPSSSGAWTLQRASTITSGNTPGRPPNPQMMYATKAVLNIPGNLALMADKWTAEECEAGRRLVLFGKKQQGSSISLTYKAVTSGERPPGTICVSCIYWKEMRECFITSVDAIALLERIVDAPRFSVDEKNRIRRNLECYRPISISKSKPDNGEFFKVIMGFPNPKPRNIEKDIKVFPWKKLAEALKKIIAKYSATPHSPPSHHAVSTGYHATSGAPTLLTPVSTTSPGLYIPPPHTPTMTDPTGTYGGHHLHHSHQHQHHHDSLTTSPPRTLSSGGVATGTLPSSSWGTYHTTPTTSTTRATLSPGLKSLSPLSLRTPTYGTHPGYGMPPSSSASSHHHSHHRWDGGYGDTSAYTTTTSGHHQNHHQHQHHTHSSHAYGVSPYSTGGHHRD